MVFQGNASQIENNAGLQFLLLSLKNINSIHTHTHTHTHAHAQIGVITFLSDKVITRVMMQIAAPLIMKISDEISQSKSVEKLLKALEIKIVKGRYLCLSENRKQGLSQNGKNILANRDNNSKLSAERTATIS